MNEPISDATENQAEFQPRGASPNEPESKLWEGGFSPKAMYGTWLISGLVTLGIVVAELVVPFADMTGLSSQAVWTIGIGLILLWWVFAIGTYVYHRWSTFYELTTQRFIHTSGILVRTTDRIDVIDIDDVAYTQGIVQRMLGVGTIRMNSKDRSHPILVLRGIDQVAKVSGMIDDVRRKERKKRSLHIDAS